MSVPGSPDAWLTMPWLGTTHLLGAYKILYGHLINVWSLKCEGMTYLYLKIGAVCKDFGDLDWRGETKTVVLRR